MARRCLEIRILPISLMLASLLLGLPCHAETSSQYVQELAQLDAGVRALIRHGSGAQAQIDSARRALGGVYVVQTPDAGPEPTDCRLLLKTVHAAEGAGTQQAQRLSEVDRQIREVEQQISSAAGSRAAPIAIGPVMAARAELAGDDYGSDPLPEPSWLDRELGRFSDWLNRLLRPRSSHIPAGPVISIRFIEAILWCLVGALFIGLVVVLVQWLMRSSGRANLLALDETEAALMQARDTSSLQALAEQHADKGDYRRAFRLVYLATLMALDSGGVLRFDRSKTNWECLRALRAAGRTEVVEQLTPFTREFDHVWYGLKDADISDYERARTRCATAQAAVK